MRHYSLFALIPGVVGGLLTSVAALILSASFGSLGLADYEPMKPEFHLPVWVAVAGVVIPALIYYFAAMLRVRRLLSEDTVRLLAGQVGCDAKSRRILSRKKAPIKRKFAVRQLVGSPGRSFVIFLGIFLGAMIVAFAFSFIDSVKAVGVQAHGEFGSFKYEYILNTLKDGKPEDGEAVFVLPYEDKEARRFTLMGLDGDAKRKMSRQIIEGVAAYVKLPDGGKGLDVGCGSGALAIACAKRYPNASFIGIDRWGKEYASFNKPLCERNAKAEGVKNVTFAKGDACKLDFPDETFDAVTSNYVYHNIPSNDRQAILLETLRVLKKGGTFAIHDIFSKSRYGDMQAFVKKLKDMGYEKVELIDSTGRFMTKWESVWMELSGSALLAGRK